jgi:hypothetical protein
VPNTKVVVNIQIYLHAKFHIFLRSPSISPIFILSYRFIQWEKGFELEKIIVGRFLRGRPSSTPTPAIPMCEPACQPAITSLPLLIDGSLLSSPSFPKSSPAPCRVSTSANSHRRAGHPSSACTTSMSTCPSAIVSHRVGCGALWHPIAAAATLLLPSLLQPGCPPQELDDEVSSRLAHAALSHPLAAGR